MPHRETSGPPSGDSAFRPGPRSHAFQILTADTALSRSHPAAQTAHPGRRYSNLSGCVASRMRDFDPVHSLNLQVIGTTRIMPIVTLLGLFIAALGGSCVSGDPPSECIPDAE